jgi:HAD superfamily hydrolase (TIGR01459 family)
MHVSASPQRLAGLSDIASSFRAVLCDVWGVVHDGLMPIAPAVGALTAFRRSGGVVILITNAPRPRWSVIEQLQEIGVAMDCFDDVISSGDVARAVLGEHDGARIFHLGPARDHPIYDGLPITLSDLATADLVSCTGLFDDETETAEDYDPMLTEMAARTLSMICSNPDLVVERGNRLVPCAGALAARYRQLGGDAVVVGKPYAPIYQQALARIAALAGEPIEPGNVLAIGDGAATDVVGANQAGLPCLFVSSGINAIGPKRESPNGDGVAALLEQHGAEAAYHMARLSW